MNDANTSSTAFSMPFSYVQHLLIFGLENWAEIKRNPFATRPRDSDEERLGRARERESDGVLGRACQLRLPTMAAQGGLQLRVSSRREKREDERGGALLSVTLRGAPPRRAREKERLVDRPTDRSITACLGC